jgi:tetratricopeptide (TPR) repeat protein
MKLLFFLLMTCSALAADIDVPIRSDGGSMSYATEGLRKVRGTLKPPPSIYDIEELNLVLFSDMKEQSDDLKKVKYYLINGEIRLAKIYLSKLTYQQTKLRPVIYRYLAILNFMTSDFEKTYEYLSLPELQNLPHYAKICTLKVLSEIVLNKTVVLEDDWTRCQLENPGNFRERNLIWLETLVQLKLKPEKGITKIPFKRLKLAGLDNEELKVMLKLALYLNQEILVLDQLAELTMEQLGDNEVRELAGQIFFRTGALAKSYRFVEDLKSPNSENIKGNLYLLRNKYELAYAQFKLALEQKQNSQNAMERLLPLAWLLGDWEGGSKYSEMVIASPQTQINKLTLTAAFLMQKGDYDKADRVLLTIAERSRRGAEIDVTQLASFTALMQNKPDIVRKQANMSCAQYDLINCWVLFQLGQWDAFPLTIRREEKLSERRDWEKLVKEDFNQPLKETVYVNQIDIEEMDDKLIQLIPKQ